MQTVTSTEKNGILNPRTRAVQGTDRIGKRFRNKSTRLSSYEELMSYSSKLRDIADSLELLANRIKLGVLDSVESVLIQRTRMEMNEEEEQAMKMFSGCPSGNCD